MKRKQEALTDLAREIELYLSDLEYKRSLPYWPASSDLKDALITEARAFLHQLAACGIIHEKHLNGLSFNYLPKTDVLSVLSETVGDVEVVDFAILAFCYTHRVKEPSSYYFNLRELRNSFFRDKEDETHQVIMFGGNQTENCKSNKVQNEQRSSGMSLLQWLTASKGERIKISKTTNDILEMQVQKKELELQLKNSKEEVALERRQHERSLEEERHKHKLEMQTKNEQLARKEAQWNEDKTRLENQLKVDNEALRKKLEQEFKLKEEEVVALTKLESQQKQKQAELDKDRTINELKAQHQKEMTEFKEKLLKENYDKMTESMQNLHEKGNQATKFIQEIAIKMLDKAPGASAQMSLIGNANDFIDATPKEKDAKTVNQ